MISVFNRIENIVGKRRKCFLRAFSTLPTLFSKNFFFRVVKSQDEIFELTSRLWEKPGINWREWPGTGNVKKMLVVGLCPHLPPPWVSRQKNTVIHVGK